VLNDRDDERTVGRLKNDFDGAATLEDLTARIAAAAQRIDDMIANGRQILASPGAAGPNGRMSRRQRAAHRHAGQPLTHPTERDAPASAPDGNQSSPSRVEVAWGPVSRTEAETVQQRARDLTPGEAWFDPDHPALRDTPLVSVTSGRADPVRGSVPDQVLTTDLGPHVPDGLYGVAPVPAGGSYLVGRGADLTDANVNVTGGALRASSGTYLLRDLDAGASTLTEVADRLRHAGEYLKRLAGVATLAQVDDGIVYFYFRNTAR
jgi:hypothetical protein